MTIYFTVIQLYKNLENKFDLLEKEIEEGKRKKYEYLNEKEHNINNNINNNININNITNNSEYEKNHFLEILYKMEKNKENKIVKKNNKNYKYSSTKLSQRNINEKINNNKNISENNRNKTPSSIRKKKK